MNLKLKKQSKGYYQVQTAEGIFHIESGVHVGLKCKTDWVVSHGISVETLSSFIEAKQYVANCIKLLKGK